MEPAAVEDAIVAQLQLTITDDISDVIPMPENEADFRNPPTTKGKIIVGFQNSDYGNALTTLPIAQPEKMCVIVTIQSRTLRGHSGVYTLFSLVKETLIGWTVPDAESPTIAKWFGPPDIGTKPRVDDVWTWEFHVETKGILVQTVDIDPTVSPAGDTRNWTPPNPLPDDGRGISTFISLTEE